MSDNRTVTIGVVVNLGNYESLRLEVSDKAATKEEVDSLREFLAEVLDGFANNSASARSAVEKYKKNILADAESVDEPSVDVAHPLGDAFYNEISPGSDFEESKDESGASEFDEIDEKISAEPYGYSAPEISGAFDDESKQDARVYAGYAPETKPTEDEFVDEEPDIEPEQVSVPVSSPAEGEYFCEKCGERITKVQRDVSNLFMGKSLCKNCMK